jgi:hypothetical protein
MDRNANLVLDVLDATRDVLRVGVSSSMSVTYEGGWDALGAHAADLLVLKDNDQQLLGWLLRRGEARLEDVATFTGQDPNVVRGMLGELVKDGYLRELQTDGHTSYRVHMARRRTRTVPEHIWRALEADGGSPRGDRHGSASGARRLTRRIRDSTLGGRGRFVVSLAPVVLVFMLTEWLLATGNQSFAAPLSYGGVITATLAGGILPVLMLIAARRKAELVPGLVLRFLGHPIVAGGIYALFVANLFLHGLVIWSGAIEQASALATGVLAVGATIGMVRGGAFVPRAVVELRDDQRERQGTVFGITVKGEPVRTNVRLRYADREQTCEAAAGGVPELSALREAVFEIPANDVRQLKVWAHQISPAGQSERIPAVVNVACGGQSAEQFDLRLIGEQILVPLTGGKCTVQISPQGSTTPASP